MPLVLIGTCDEPVSKKHDIDWATNKIGGIPNWMTSDIPQHICRNCQSCLHLVLQLYCPLESSPYHRTLYLFACINRKCFNNKQSWFAVRCQRLDLMSQESYFKSPSQEFNLQNQFPAAMQSGFEPSIVMDTWCQGQDSWGELDPNMTVSTPNFSCRSNDYIDELTQLCNLSLSESQKSPEDEQPLDMLESDSSSEECNDAVDSSGDSKTQSELKMVSDNHFTEQKHCFNSFYINAFEETMLSLDSSSTHVQSLLDQYNSYEKLECNTNEFSVSDSEHYEKDKTNHGDTVFYKFFKRISICPEQVVRYSWKGTPLYLRQPNFELLEIPGCQSCGGPCVFELQAMPALVNYLRLPNVEGVPVEFGTVIVYTCKSSCWKEGDTFKEEYVFVQPDPDAELLQ